MPGARRAIAPAARASGPSASGPRTRPQRSARSFQPARRVAAPAPAQAGGAGCRSGRRHPAALPARRRGHRRGASTWSMSGGSRDPVPAARREHQREDRTGCSVTEPIRVEFEVACSPAHVFDTWANKTSMWWPRSHSMSSAPGLVVTFESRPAAGSTSARPTGPSTTGARSWPGSRPAAWQRRNRQGWAGLLPHHQGAVGSWPGPYPTPGPDPPVPYPGWACRSLNPGWWGPRTGG
jgi:hypothetical protein